MPTNSCYLLKPIKQLEERQDILVGFKEDRYLAGVTSKILKEGVDVSDAKLGIIVCGTRSGREFIHRLGRFLRPKVDTPDATNTSTTTYVKARLIEIVSSDTRETGTSERRKKAFTRVYQKGYWLRVREKH